MVFYGFLQHAPAKWHNTATETGTVDAQIITGRLQGFFLERREQQHLLITSKDTRDTHALESRHAEKLSLTPGTANEVANPGTSLSLKSSRA